MADRMPCMAVKQPWASLLVSGTKDVENRSSALPDQLRGRWCAIYASKTLATVGSWIDAFHRYSSVAETTAFWPWTPNHKIARKLCVRGAIVGLVKWDASRTVRKAMDAHTSPWAEPGMHHWTYSDRIVLPEPVPLTDGGCQSLYWYLSDDTMLALMTRIADTGRDIPMDVLAAWSSAGVPEREPLTDITGCDV